MFIIPDGKDAAMQAADTLRNIGMPETVAAMIEEAHIAQPDTCGRCTAYDPETGMCGERAGMKVLPADRACAIFVDLKATY
jgi:hypothetical protein